MAYVISLDLREHEFDNLTAEWYLKERDIHKNDDFADWLKFNEDVLDQTKDLDELFEKFVEEEEEEIYERYSPVVTYQHVLQSEPDEKQLELVARLCPNVTVVYVPVVDAHLLTLNGCGMDLSEELELAYWIIDGISPIKASWFRDKKREELVNWCRENKPTIMEIKQKVKELEKSKK